MSENSRDKGSYRILRICILLCTIWTLLIGTFCFLAIRNQNDIPLELARVEASASYNKDIVYRRWSSLHGGAYVPVSETTKPNPYLNVEERDISTPSGRILTLINPAYMTRQVYDLAEKESRVKGHLTSLNPIRPENAPYTWEVEVLKSFERGEKEFRSITVSNNEEFLRFMMPMYTEKSCLKCHAEQGYKEGDLRGGISISVPLAPYNAIRATTIKIISIVYSIICIMGLFVLIITFNMLNRQYRRQTITETALRQSEEKFRTIVENVNDGIYTTDFNGKILDINENVCRIIGYTDSELIGSNISIFDDPEHASLYKKQVERLLDEGHDIFEGEYLKKDGTAIPVTVSSKIVSREGTGRVQSVVRDITELKKAEEQLRFQAKLLDAVEQSVIATNVKGKILYWNPYSERLYGWKKSEAMGRDLLKLIVPKTEKTDANKVHNAISKGKSLSGEVKVKNHSGDIFPVLITASPVYNEMEEITGVISIAIDLTEKKKLEAQLQQTQKMEGIGTLAGGIAHDFNNILAPIILHSQMAIEDISQDNSLRTSIKEIYNAAKRARDLVKQILTFARKGKDHRIILQASLVIKEAVKFLRSTIPTTIDIRYDNKSDHDTIYANPTQINQIVMNLCTNAAHSMKDKGGVIDVILDYEDIKKNRINGSADLKKGQYLTLTVKDSGTGIAPEIMDKIFEPYFTTKKSGEGTGLGLAIIHGIVKNHNGDVTVKSAPGQGTTFKIYLPLVDEKMILEEEEKTDIPEGSGHVLFVDDEEAAVTAMEKILTRLGYSSTATTSSLEALDLFQNSPESFDLIITDMTMPDMTGKALAEKIRLIRPDIPVILYTGFSDQIDEEEAKKAGIDEFMIKPLNMNDIAFAIRKVLDTHDKQNSKL